MMPEKYAPYAPLGNVVAVLDRLRGGWKPETIDVNDVIASGVSGGNAPRTLAALEFLGLIEPGGRASPAARTLAEMPTDHYKGFLATLIKESYKEILGRIDPESASDLEIEDAFRLYSPATQKGRMATLFIGLCQLAGLRPGQPRLLTKPRKRRAPQDEQLPPQKPYAAWVDEFEPLLKSLPEGGPGKASWSEEERARWTKAFLALLDIRIKLKEVDDTEFEREES